MTEATIDELEFWVKECEAMVAACDRIARQNPRMARARLAKAKREGYADIASRMRTAIECAKKNNEAPND